MLETDEVDDDYFTPISSVTSSSSAYRCPNRKKKPHYTSLANIFGRSTHQDETTKNESLKYTPPKEIIVPKNEETNVSECVFACAVFGYEWVTNAYSNKGKIGFAITKNKKNNVHDILIYDSHKTTLSMTTITPTFELTVKGNLHISFYDNFNKYWTILATEDEIKKIVEILKNINVRINYTPNTYTGPVELKTESERSAITTCQSDKESDTDSLNKRTKAAILNRMANMGQPVLPRNDTKSVEETSDSSDSNEIINNLKFTRPKPVKNLVNRINIDNDHSDEKNPVQTCNNIFPSDTRTPVCSSLMYQHYNGQVVPMENSTSLIMNSGNLGNDMNLFLTEQRINNSEIRINVSRMTDKVDKVFDKIQEIEDNCKNNITPNFQIEIFRKLLIEYENKIKVYEEIMKSKEINSDYMTPLVRELSNKISELESIIVEKDNEIMSLVEEIKLVKEKQIELAENQRVTELLKEITNLKETLSTKQVTIDNTMRKLKEMLIKTDNENDFENKLKSIMNNTFRTLSVNFDNSETYSSDTIKTIIATVIKKVTVDFLSENQ